jgi:peptidoglycan/LPS O-acetylase OafA/YrhL
MIRLSKAQGTALDLMRGLSAQVVLMGHALDANGVTLPCYPPDLAVVLFLFISGFLITYSTAVKGADYTLPEFLIDRGARIFVPYLPAMLVVILAGLAFQLPGPLHVLNVITSALMLQNYPIASYFPAANMYFDPIGTGRPWWTVAVEWWFYCAFGALYFFLRGRDRPLWLFPLIGIPGFIVVMFQSISWVLFYPWLCGCVGAFLFLAGSHVPRAGFLIPPLLGLVCIRYYFHPNFYDLQGMIVACALVWVIIVSVRDVAAPEGFARFSAFIAGYSYTLYLLNATVIAVLKPLLAPGAWTFALMLFGANAAAYAFSLVTERHYKAVARWLKQGLTVDRTGKRYGPELAGR